MEMNSANVEEVVKQVLESMLKSPVATPAASAPAPASQAIPKTAHVAMLTYSCKSRRIWSLWNRRTRI